jgi:hypothetical protein
MERDRKTQLPNTIKFKNEEVIMRCDRCNGRMAHEVFYGAEGAYFGWRCIACGEIIDQVILENRYGPKLEKVA